MIPQITTHFADGRPSETRDMTEEEINQLPTGMPEEHEVFVPDSDSDAG